MRSSFDAGWPVRPKQNFFLEMTGDMVEWADVTSPHDAVIGTPRDPSGSQMTGYFNGCVWEYTKLAQSCVSG